LVPEKKVGAALLEMVRDAALSARLKSFLPFAAFASLA
jgi:hypothetical protein